MTKFGRIIASCLKAVTLGIISCAFAACGTGGGTLPGGSQPGPTTGSFVDYAVNQYDNWTPLSGNYAIQNAVDQGLKADNWYDADYQRDINVTADRFSWAAQNADALFFAGHGDVGVTAFTHEGTYGTSVNSQYWGPGSADYSVPSNTFGAPLAGRLKWMFLSSSDTVAPEREMDPFDDIAWTVPQNGWRQFFVGGGETLRGIYGYWQSPGGNCPGNRSCDVPDNDQATTAGKRRTKPPG